MYSLIFTTLLFFAPSALGHLYRDFDPAERNLTKRALGKTPWATDNLYVVDQELNSLPIVKSTIKPLSELPLYCLNQDMSGMCGDDGGSMKAHQITFADCPSSSYVVCQCGNVQQTIESLADTFSRYPPAPRSHIRYLLQRGNANTCWTAGRDIAMWDQVTSDVFFHEGAHAVDGGSLSQAAAFNTALGQDTCVPNDYANGNQAEDFAELSRVYATQVLLKRHLDTTTCMSKQLGYLATGATTSAAYLSSATCDMNVRAKVQASIAATEDRTSVKSKFARYPSMPDEVRNGINSLPPLGKVVKTVDSTSLCDVDAPECGTIEGRTVSFSDCPSSPMLLCRCSNAIWSWDQFYNHMSALPSGLRDTLGKTRLIAGQYGHMTGSEKGKGGLSIRSEEPLLGVVDAIASFIDPMTTGGTFTSERAAAKAQLQAALTADSCVPEDWATQNDNNNRLFIDLLSFTLHESLVGPLSKNVTCLANQRNFVTKQYALTAGKMGKTCAGGAAPQPAVSSTATSSKAVIATSIRASSARASSAIASSVKASPDSARSKPTAITLPASSTPVTTTSSRVPSKTAPQPTSASRPAYWGHRHWRHRHWGQRGDRDRRMLHRADEAVEQVSGAS